MWWDSPDDKKSFKRWSWAERMQVTHRQKWEDWRKRAFGVGTEAWKITWCLWKAWEQGRTRSHCNGRPRWKDTANQLAGALSVPPTSESSLVYLSGSGKRKEFKPILRYIQSLDNLTESAWDFPLCFQILVKRKQRPSGLSENQRLQREVWADWQCPEHAWPCLMRLINMTVLL